MKKDEMSKLFSHIPTLETERLILRQMNICDLDDMYEYSKNEEVTKYLLWSPHPDKNYTMQYLRYLRNKYRLGDCYDWGIIEKESGKMIGSCGFAKIDVQNNCGEIGYVINPDFWRKGIASEASRAVMSFGFYTLGFNRIEGRFFEENTASRRVMEKNGMKFEGVHRQSMLIKGEYRNIGVCAVLKDEFFKK